MLAPDAFRPRDDGQSSHERLLAELDRKSKRPGNDAIQSFIKKYGNELPVWVATEAMDFGDASRLIGMLDQSMLSRVARPYDLQSGPQMNSWTRAMCCVRNIAAHHERLWNRRINDAPMKPKGKEARHFNELEKASQETWGRPYATLLVIAYFVDRIQRTDDWSHALGRHLTTLPIGPGVDTAAMGAPAGWQSNPFWGL